MRPVPTAYCLLPTRSRGFALLIAVIFMSVMLALGLSLGSLGYKQQLLASMAVESQYAFYAADTGLECALLSDQQLNLFDYASHSEGNPPTLITCNNTVATLLGYSYNAEQLIMSQRLSLDSNTRCADVTVYKYASAQPPANLNTAIFSQGYDVSCATVASPNGARFVSRGLNAHFGGAVPTNNGVCAATHYSCSVGTSGDVAESGTGWTWTCAGVGDGSTASCEELKPADGVCAATHYSCTAGTSTDNVDGQYTWTWTCAGVGGGATAACSEPKITGPMALTGYAWSSLVGWISFSGTTYGVSEDKISGALSGYAWSSNIGWISFSASDGSHPAPVANFISGSVSGWARACTAFADKNACSGALDPAAGGWDGWIALSGTAADGTPYGISQNSSCVWSGYAWGSEGIGAISVSGTATDGSAYGISGDDSSACYPH